MSEQVHHINGSFLKYLLELTIATNVKAPEVFHSHAF